MISGALSCPLLFGVVYRADYCVTNRKNDDECARIRAARLSNPSCADLVERLLFAQNCRGQKSQNRISFHHADRTQTRRAALCKWLGLTNVPWQITESIDIRFSIARKNRQWNQGRVSLDLEMEHKLPFYRKNAICVQLSKNCCQEHERSWRTKTRLIDRSNTSFVVCKWDGCDFLNGEETQAF